MQEMFIPPRDSEMTVFHDAVGDPETCVYLPTETSQIHHRLIDRCTPEAYQDMLQRGWRRFGNVFFRPVCPNCTACRSLRLEVEIFRPGRSMRRNWRANQDVDVVFGPSAVTPGHLDLYGRYHEDMSRRKQWREKSVSPSEYAQSFVDGRQDYGHELRYFLAGQLLGVALVDILPEALSAVYCYYDPTQRRRGIGVFSVLQQVELARRLGKRYLYLGYWVAENASMRYKSRYRPHELLVGRPEAAQTATWTAASKTGASQGVAASRRRRDSP